LFLKNFDKNRAKKISSFHLISIKQFKKKQTTDQKKQSKLIKKIIECK